MAAEPITIYSFNTDPQGVFEKLRALAPDLEVTDGTEGWSTITIRLKQGFFRKQSTLSFRNDPSAYRTADFPREMKDIQEYVSTFPQNELTDRIMMLIRSFRFGITLSPSPEPELNFDSDDPRLKYIYAVAQQLEGAIFTPSGFRDSSGRLLYQMGGKRDPNAVMPAIYTEAPQPSEIPKYKGGTAPNPAHPTTGRIAQRAFCLAAVSFRGMLERENGSPEQLDHDRADVLHMLDEVGAAAELEPEERRLLEQPVGKGAPGEMTDAEWRIEGAGVLSWALNRFDLPAYDIAVDVGKISQAVGFSGTEACREFLANPTLRPVADIEQLSRQLLGLHWRFREQEIRPGKKDFEKGSQNAWFGNLPLDGIRFVDGDLAIGPHSISTAPEEILIPCTLTVQERHKAINWLCGDDPLYSKTDTPT